ncbi:MAG: SDR family oxidoreductase [Candidatus Endonucleobacter bathymodioli]|uniref:SDR family oxidoreductase n=1 Tax=Candidatus Endonucleibacter bathymodioli TaxID=539814 RepID=A0AA90NNJ4_9GAMM|nr:SDR family oxidoreductase [Candidatus Endonucleobacter bathymodioli]
MVIITGASSGVGEFLMDYFDGENRVCGIYNTSKKSGSKLRKVDIRDFEDVDEWISSLSMSLEDKVVLINCAGINYDCFGHKADPLMWKNVIDTNLIGTFNVIRSVLPHMRAAKYGRIINIGSVVAQKGVLGTSAYAASKSALWGLSKALATENAGKGITINNINLGYSNVGMGLTQITAGARETLTSSIPAQRFSSPSEIATTIDYLIATEYINGSSVDLNGAYF